MCFKDATDTAPELQGEQGDVEDDWVHQDTNIVCFKDATDTAPEVQEVDVEDAWVHQDTNVVGVEDDWVPPCSPRHEHCVLHLQRILYQNFTGSFKMNNFHFDQDANTAGYK